MQRPDVLVKLDYIWRHVSTVNRPSSGQHNNIINIQSNYLSSGIPLDK